MLAFAWVEVGVEHGEKRAVIVKHLICFHIFVIDRYFRIFLECDAIESCSESEDTVDDVVKFEIRSEHLCIDIIFLEFEDVRKVRSVPWFHSIEFLFAFSCFQRLFRYVVLLFYCCGFICVYEFVQQFIHLALVCCHALFENIVCIALISEQLCYFQSQVYYSPAYILVVLSVAMVADGVFLEIHLFA